MSWFSDLLAKFKPAKQEFELQVAKTVDEVADSLRAEANDLVQRWHSARTQAAELLEEASEEAKEAAEVLKDQAKVQAENLNRRAKALEELAAERIRKAQQDRNIADKLKDLIGQ